MRNPLSAGGLKDRKFVFQNCLPGALEDRKFVLQNCHPDPDQVLEDTPNGTNTTEDARRQFFLQKEGLEDRKFVCRQFFLYFGRSGICRTSGLEVLRTILAGRS